MKKFDEEEEKEEEHEKKDFEELESERLPLLLQPAYVAAPGILLQALYPLLPSSMHFRLLQGSIPSSWRLGIAPHAQITGLGAFWLWKDEQACEPWYAGTAGAVNSTLLEEGISAVPAMPSMFDWSSMFSSPWEEASTYLSSLLPRSTVCRRTSYDYLCRSVRVCNGPRMHAAAL